MNKWPGFCECPAPSGGVWPLVILAAMFGLFLLSRWLWWKFSWKGWLTMSGMFKIIAVLVLVLAVAGVLALRQNGEAGNASEADNAVEAQEKQAAREESVSGPRPRLVSLGAGKCIPCKAMEPIREELQEEYASRLQVVYHDVWQDREIGQKYGIRLIPTLIYFDAEGNEIGRTEGYQTKQQILDAFAQWGVELRGSTGSHAEAGS